MFGSTDVSYVLLFCPYVVCLRWYCVLGTQKWTRQGPWDTSPPPPPHPHKPVVKTLHFHCKGTGLISGQETKMPLSAAKNKNKNKKKFKNPTRSLPLTTPRGLIPWFSIPTAALDQVRLEFSSTKFNLSHTHGLHPFLHCLVEKSNFKSSKILEYKFFEGKNLTYLFH